MIISRYSPHVIDDDDDDGSDTSSFTIDNDPDRLYLPNEVDAQRPILFSPLPSRARDSDARNFTIDNDPDRLYFLDEVNAQRPTPFTPLPPREIEVVDLTGTQSFLEGEYVTDECYEILQGEWNRSVPRQLSSPVHEVPAREALNEVCVGGIVYKVGQSVELHDGTYLRICCILKDVVSREFYFSGRRLLKTKNHVGTYIPKRANEMVWIANEATDIPLAIVKRFVNIVFTNSCEITQESQINGNPGTFFCRLKEILETDMVSIEYLSEEEADPRYRVKSTILREAWRGDTLCFGSSEGSPVIVLDDVDAGHEPSLLEQKEGRRYTFGDGFCGAGGVSCGAQRAGLSVKWSFDLSHHATATYRLNFPMAECETSDIFSFLTNDDEFVKVDVTHGSPPCQTFSPAHTVESVNDDANSACIFSCGNLIRKAKPRVHTMEETSGLFERHKETFYGVIHDFIEIGYSVRWSILNCMNYGVPQSRKRLIIIASGPGETLPPFPKPTHGFPGSGLQQLATINQMISNIPPGTPDHDVEGARSRGLHRAPFDPNQQARTITCGGGDNNYHPSGRRGFTNREFACLQTFPLSFRFGQREVRKQIGNAVPPLLAQAVYQEIRKTLQETDEREVGRSLQTESRIVLP